MTSFRFAPGFVLVLAGLAPHAPASAQQIPIVQSGADGRFERQIDPKTTVPGFDPVAFRGFRSSMDAIIAQLAAMPSVNAPSAPVCHRLMSYLEIVRRHGVFAGSVSVFSPIKFENGRCHRMTGGGIELIINSTLSTFEANRAQVRDAEGGRANWFVMKPEFDGRIIRLTTGEILLTNGRALLVPVSGKRYVAEQVKREAANLPPGAQLPRPWRDLSQRLTPDAAARPACLDRSMLSMELTADCDPRLQLWEVNPNYFDSGRMGDIQMIVLRTPQGAYHGESDARLKARQAVWHALDLAALSAMVR